MELDVGDTVRIINADGIECNDNFFKNGDITTITTFRDYLCLKHDDPELSGGLVLTRSEYNCVEKIS